MGTWQLFLGADKLLGELSLFNPAAPWGIHVAQAQHTLTLNVIYHPLFSTEALSRYICLQPSADKAHLISLYQSTSH